MSEGRKVERSEGLKVCNLNGTFRLSDSQTLRPSDSQTLIRQLADQTFRPYLKALTTSTGVNTSMLSGRSGLFFFRNNTGMIF